MNASIAPPKPKKIPKKLEIHNDIRVDEYYWLNDKENPEVIAHLEAENDYYNHFTAPINFLKEKLFKEMKARIKEDDSSVPYKYNGYWYSIRFEKGKEYPIYLRRKGTLEAKEELLFDGNEMAKDYDYFHLTGLSVSPNNTLITFATDTVGRRNYTIRIKNLVTGEILPDQIENTTGSATWANDNSTLFYTTKDPQTLRSDKVFKHKLGALIQHDQLVYHEKDEMFNVQVQKSKSQAYIIIGSHSTLSDEYHVLKADTPDHPFKVFQKRQRNLEYSISHYNNNFYIVTNKDGASNFKLMKTPETQMEVTNWKEVLPHRSETLLEDIDIFKDYLVISERTNGLTKIRIKKWDNTTDYYIPFDNETYTAYTSTNVDFDTPVLRYSYNALNTPTSVIDFDMDTQKKTILKEQEVLGGKFKKENYITKRLWASSHDGVKVPISIIYKKGLKMDGNNPLLLYGYGSYGVTVDPYFSSSRLSLLDRGFVFAIAHVRGGQYLGRSWYEDGKLLHKKNTFIDFIACSNFLIAEKFTSSNHLYAYGGSAGGLLVGAVINRAPQLYNGVIAAVPFVDVVTTMLDNTIPLTTGEYDEWGDPNNVIYYNYMKSYSPYDNISRLKYPNLFVTSGLHDSQVQYWEPTKWVAKIRDYNSSENKILLKTNMKAGHSGASGRFESLKELAEEYAFLLSLENILQ